MRDTRKKLIDLLDAFPVQMEWHDNADLANYLLSNGVLIPVRCSDCEWFKNGTCKNAWGIALKNAVAIICWTFLACHFGKWWIALFGALFLTSVEWGKKDND